MRDPVGDDLHLAARVCVESDGSTEVEAVFRLQRLQPEMMSRLHFADRGTDLGQERLLPGRQREESGDVLDR